MRLIPVCESCEKGEGGECHTPGCSFWMRKAPKEALQYNGASVLPDENALMSVIGKVFPLGSQEIEEKDQLSLARRILFLLGYGNN